MSHIWRRPREREPWLKIEWPTPKQWAWMGAGCLVITVALVVFAGYQAHRDERQQLRQDRRAQKERAERQTALDRRVPPEEQAAIRAEVGPRPILSGSDRYTPKLVGPVGGYARARLRQWQEHREAARIAHGLSQTEMDMIAPAAN